MILRSARRLFAPRAALGRRAALALLALTALAGRAAAQPTLDALAAAQLPSWARPAFEAPAFRERWLLDLSLNPFVQSGDFDGDGFADVAVLVRDAATGARGVALLLQDERAPLVLGAGAADIPVPGDAELSWLLVWHVERRLPAGAALAPAGDTLVLAALDGARLWLLREGGGWRLVAP